MPALGRRHLARGAARSAATGSGFSPDGRLLVVQDANRVIRLVEAETGRTVARLESPDSCHVDGRTFSPDGSRLVVITNDGPAVHVWDLRAIRRRLAEMDLDWDTPPYPDADPAGPSAPPLPPLQVELDPLERATATCPTGRPMTRSPCTLDASAGTPRTPSLITCAVMPCCEGNGSPRPSTTSTGRSTCGPSTSTCGRSGERSTDP